MFVGRKRELQLLQDAFTGDKPPFVVLYGRYGIGKTTLIRQFTKDKECVYYLGRECSKEEQNSYIEERIQKVFEKAEKTKGRVVFIIDEFVQIYKGNKDFFAELMQVVMNETFMQKGMLILASSSIQWVENEMVKTMGPLAMRMTNFIKIKEFTFLEMVNRFPDCTTEECVAIYGLLGGVPAYLNFWDKEKSVKENIMSIFLSNEALLKNEATNFLKLDLRELSVYNTVLSELAKDEYKLNYLYQSTGFSRAKLSVYIKNLIQLDVACKIFSFEIEKKENIQKGLYGISDNFIHFYYKYVFPHLSDANWMEAEHFYFQYIEPTLDEYLGLAYIRVCKEFLELMNHLGKLPVHFDTFGSLYAKNAFIPLISESEDGKLLVGACKWDQVPMDEEEFMELVEGMEKIQKGADYYYLFSKEGFTDNLSVMTEKLDNVTLVDLESL